MDTRGDSLEMSANNVLNSKTSFGSISFPASNAAFLCLPIILLFHPLPLPFLPGDPRLREELSRSTRSRTRPEDEKNPERTEMNPKMAESSRNPSYVSLMEDVCDGGRDGLLELPPSVGNPGKIEKTCHRKKGWVGTRCEDGNVWRRRYRVMMSRSLSDRDGVHRVASGRFSRDDAL